MPPYVSVIICNWNGAGVLPRCLAALNEQSYSDFEVIIVDNGSSDGSVKEIEAQWPGLQLRVERLTNNLGFAAANNLGARLARGDWLALLNSDAFPTPTWLEQLIQTARANTDYTFFASRLLQAERPDYVDGLGDVYHISGLAWRRYHGCRAEGLGLVAEEVFSPCAAAALFARSEFLAAGGFDETFGSYHEDVDLGFRLRLRGQRCLYVPTAVVYHVGSSSYGARSDFVIYHGQRNLVWCYFQNMPGHLFWKYLPAQLVATMLFLIFYTLRGQARAIWSAKLDAGRGLWNVLGKRRLTQAQRRVAPAAVERALDRSWFGPYLGSRWRRS